MGQVVGEQWEGGIPGGLFEDIPLIVFALSLSCGSSCVQITPKQVPKKLIDIA
jgi:hypothetical protein